MEWGPQGGAFNGRPPACLLARTLGGEGAQPALVEAGVRALTDNDP